MKKIIIIFMLVSVSCIGAIDLYTFGSFSYDYEKVGYFNDQSEEWFESSIASGVSQELWIFDFYAEAEMVTEMYMVKIPSWQPTHDDYFVRSGFWVGFLNIEYEHLCMHNVDDIDYRRNGGHNRVTVGFDSRRIGK
jgi:hypothetical protein